MAFFFILDFEAAKTGLVGLPKDQLPSLKAIMMKQGYLLFPIVVMIFTLVILRMSPIRAGIYSLFSVIILSWFNQETRMGIRRIFNALQITGKTMITVASTCAGAGIILGVISLTGIGGKLAMMILAWSQGNLLAALILTMLITLVLGMGLPTVAAYIICASVVAPSLTLMGINELVAHMFIFYFACISAITPPVALASFAAAGIAETSPWRVGMMSFRIAFAAYVIPFMIVYTPALLAKGTILQVSGALAIASFGVFSIAGSLQGWFLYKATLPERILMFISGVFLIHANLTSDIVGLVALAIVLSSQLSMRFSFLKPFAFLMLRKGIKPGIESRG